MMEFMPCATRSRLWCDFDMPFHPGCHRPFYRSTDVRSLPLLSLGLLAVLFDFCLFYASATLDHLLQHVLTSTVVTLRPFAPYLPSWRVLLFVEGAGIEPAMSYAFFAAYPRHLIPFQRLFQCCLRPLSHPSVSCSVCRNVIAALSLPHLSSFMSSYTPLRMFIAISCCG